MTCQVAGFMFQRWLCLILKVSMLLKKSRKSCKNSSLEVSTHSHTQEKRRRGLTQTKSSKIEKLNPPNKVHATKRQHVWGLIPWNAYPLNHLA
jgi:hypothetical protein